MFAVSTPGDQSWGVEALGRPSIGDPVLDKCSFQRTRGRVDFDFSGPKSLAKHVLEESTCAVLLLASCGLEACVAS